MKASELHCLLEQKYIHNDMSDNWTASMGAMQKSICENYALREMGLVLDFADHVTCVYTAVFPSPRVVNFLLQTDITDAMLFVHHPLVWDSRREPAFSDILPQQIAQMREKHISLYNLHVPLDHFGPYGTSKTLAEALGLTIEKPFDSYHGALAGVFCASPYPTVTELRDAFSCVLGFEARLYPYGSEEIQGGRVAVEAGGGNGAEVVRAMLQEGVTTLVTGVTVRNSYSEEAHALEAVYGVNLLGGTHYGTEQFACRRLCAWFEEHGLPCAFLEDDPVREDM